MKSSDSGTDAVLGILTPTGGGDPIPLTGPKLLVGRRSSCDICLRFSNVSSHHCELELKNGYWHIRDLGSSNGVKVNGERVESKCVFPGDEVQIARHPYIIEYHVAPGTEAPEEENPFELGLLEKAGLEVEQRNKRMPRSSNRKVRAKDTSSEDEFIMQWLSGD